MFAENRKISIRQLQMLLLLDCFGTAVLFLPAELAEISGRGCFFAALLGGLGVSAASLLLTAVGRRMPNGTVVDWCRSVCGNGIGTILLLGLAGKLLLDGMLELRIFSEIICRFMLPATPVWVLSLVLLLVAGALAAQGTECRGRTAEILFFLVAIPLLLVLLAVAASTRYARVLPLALPSPSGIGAGLAEMSIVFRGLVFLYFIYPDLKKPVGFAVWKGCLLITAVVTVIVLLCLANYGEGMLAAKLFADIADAGACQLYGRFSDQTGFASALVLDGIGGAVSFGGGVFRLPSGDAAMQTGGKKAKALALGGACGFVCVVISARKPYGGTASAACRFALAESGVSGGTAGFVALAWQEGREKGCIKNLFCWRWQSPFF